MDSVSTQKTKPRKMKVVVKKSRVQILLDLFYRMIEITVVTVTVVKLCYQLVIMFEDFGLSRFLINRHLAFILGNMIVITIVVKCGFFVNQEPDARRNRNDFYDEFVRESSRTEQSLQTYVISTEKKIEAKHISEDKRQNRGKQSMLENKAKPSTEDKRQNRAKQSTEDKIENPKKSSGEEREKKDITVKRHRQIITQKQENPSKSYERSKSENLESLKKSSCERLKRSETERSADRFESDDELRYKIESFIARQRRNQKDEEFCII